MSPGVIEASMSKHIRIIAATLAVTMVMALCSCVKKNVKTQRNPAGRKTEFGNEWNGPDDSTSVADIIEMTEKCLGMQGDEARDYITGYFVLKDYREVDGVAGGYRLINLYDLDKDIVIGGVTFKSISITLNIFREVNHVSYSVRKTEIHEENEEFDIKRPFDRLQTVISAYYGNTNPSAHLPTVYCSESLKAGWYDGNYEILLHAGKGVEEVEGNDLFNLGVYCGDPNAAKDGPEPPSDVTVPPFESEDVSFGEVYEMMQSLIGLEAEEAKDKAGEFFGIELSLDSRSDNSMWISYLYAADMYIEGIRFTVLTLQCNDVADEDIDIVSSVKFLAKSSPEAEIHEQYQLLADKYQDILGEPTYETTHKNASEDDESVLYKLGKFTVTSLLCSYYDYEGEIYGSMFFYYEEDYH